MQGALCRTLQGHGHWVNSLALNTDYAIRTGASDPKKLMQTVPEHINNGKPFELFILIRIRIIAS
jgi:ribosome assembly protein 4